MGLESVQAPPMRSDDAAEKRGLHSAAPATEDGWLTTTQAAKLLGVSSPNTIKNWFHGGHFPGAVMKSPGGHWRFSQAAVLEMKRRMEELHERNRRGDLMPNDTGDDEVESPF